MAFGTSVTRDGHVIPGSGNRGFGRSYHSPSLIYTTPVVHTHYSSPYYTSSSYYGGRHGLIGGGITLLVLGVALTALGVFSFIIGDPPLGITFTSIGVLGALAGIACLIAKFANKNLN